MLVVSHLLICLPSLQIAAEILNFCRVEQQQIEKGLHEICRHLSLLFGTGRRACCDGCWTFTSLCHGFYLPLGLASACTEALYN